MVAPTTPATAEPEWRPQRCLRGRPSGAWKEPTTACGWGVDYIHARLKQSEKEMKRRGRPICTLREEKAPPPPPPPEARLHVEREPRGALGVFPRAGLAAGLDARGPQPGVAHLPAGRARGGGEIVRFRWQRGGG